MMPRRGVALLILVAEGSQRIGQPRQSLPARERSLIRRAVETGLASSCRPIVVAIGAHSEVVRHELQLLPVMIAYQRPASGSNSSLRVAMEALTAFDDIEGTVLMLFDQPLVTASALNRIVEAHYLTGKDIVASECEDVAGEPLYIGRRFFGEIASLHGRHGARRIMDRHLEHVTTVYLEDAAFGVDALD